MCVKIVYHIKIGLPEHMCYVMSPKHVTGDIEKAMAFETIDEAKNFAIEHELFGMSMARTEVSILSRVIKTDM